MTRMLESDEAARRLGVKVATLYAYVSRGLLVSHPASTGRRRLFDIEEIERLAHRSQQGRAVETRMVTITTGITQLTEAGPVYRGRPATGMATALAFEEVAEWLWAPGGDPGPEPPWEAPPLGRPPQIGSWDRLAWAVVMSGALDPLRADLRPEAVTRAARRAAASMVEVLPRAGRGTSDLGTAPVALVLDDGRSRAGSMAERLTLRLSPTPTHELVRAVNAALVLLADHELATSTVAVRVAASTRADVCNSLLAGIGTVSGPLHGGASQLAYSLLVEAERHGVERALNDTLRWQGSLAGFGHSVYQDGDPRFSVLLERFEALATDDQVQMVRALIGLAADHTIPPPNVDLGLAAMAWAAGMPPDAGQTIFAVARVAGWVAHYLEELGERPLRYRARAIYAASNRS